MLIKVPLIKNELDTRVIAVSIISVLLAFIAQLWFDDSDLYQNMSVENFFFLGTIIFPIGYTIYYFQPKYLYISLILISALASFVIYNILVRILP
jgi:hypothetical protein